MVRSKPGLQSTFGKGVWRCKKYTKTGCWMSKHLQKGKLTCAGLKHIVQSGAVLMGSSYVLLEAIEYLEPEDQKWALNTFNVSTLTTVKKILEMCTLSYIVLLVTFGIASLVVGLFITCLSKRIKC